MSPEQLKLKMQPTIHFPSECGYFKYRIIMNYESTIALLPRVLFVTTFTTKDEKTDMILIYDECNKNISAVTRLC
jgi:hypothetical protein